MKKHYLKKLAVLCFLIIGYNTLTATTNNDTLPAAINGSTHFLKLDGKIVSQSQLSEAFIELYLKDELIDKKNPNDKANFTFYLQKDTVYTLKVIVNNSEVKRIVINTYLPETKNNESFNFVFTVDLEPKTNQTSQLPVDLIAFDTDENWFYYQKIK